MLRVRWGGVPSNSSNAFVFLRAAKRQSAKREVRKMTQGLDTIDEGG